MGQMTRLPWSPLAARVAEIVDACDPHDPANRAQYLRQVRRALRVIDTLVSTERWGEARYLAIQNTQEAPSPLNVVCRPLVRTQGVITMYFYGGQFYIGASYCDDRDMANGGFDNSVGKWIAIKHSVAVLPEELRHHAGLPPKAAWYRQFGGNMRDALYDGLQTAWNSLYGVVIAQLTLPEVEDALVAAKLLPAGCTASQFYRQGLNLPNCFTTTIGDQRVRLRRVCLGARIEVATKRLYPLPVPPATPVLPEEKEHDQEEAPEIRGCVEG